MPLYTYTNGKETIDVYQSMNEPHVYFGKDGKEWQRVWHKPGASVDTQYNPLSAKDFSEKVGRTKGTYGDLIDRSRELSEKREKLMGKDPIKERYKKEWSAKRKGRQFPSFNKDSVIEI